MRSESLRRPPDDQVEQDRATIRAEIQRHVDEYLARGGQIRQVTSDDNRRHTWSPKDLQHRVSRFNAGPRERK